MDFGSLRLSTQLLQIVTILFQPAGVHILVQL